jgi:hypothetical protein
MDKQLIPIIREQFKVDGFNYTMDYIVLFCADPQYTNAEIYFQKADDGEMLFKISLDYDSWHVNSTEIYSDSGDDFPKAIGEFLLGHNEKEAKRYRKAAQIAVLTKVNALRGDIDYSAVDVGKMVYYSDVYDAGLFRLISFMIEGIQYSVYDDYCVNPRCKCSEIVLSFHILKDRIISGEPVLVLNFDLKKQKCSIAEKSPEITDAKLFFKGCMNFFECAGFDVFEVFKQRHAMMKKWGETMYDRLRNKDDVEVLVDEMNDALPLYCYADRNSVALLSRQGLRINVNTRLEIEGVDDLGDEGGIMCAVKTPGGGRPLGLSASHLVFKDSGEIYDKINRYKEERIKWLRQEEEKDRLMGRVPGDMYKMVETSSDGTMTFFDDEGEAGMVVFPKNRPVTTQKISRNAPCPCGSGKKYKKCCADKM